MEATARPARAAAAPAAAAAVLQGVGMEAMAAPAPVRPTAAQGVRHSAGTGKMEQMHLAAVAAATTATVLAPRRSPTHPRSPGAMVGQGVLRPALLAVAAAVQVVMAPSSPAAA
jgi:hypothetical protein